MSWIEGSTTSGLMDIDRESGVANSQADVPIYRPDQSDIIMEDKAALSHDIHDIPSPPGSASPLESTPVPPTPPSQSPPGSVVNERSITDTDLNKAASPDSSVKHPSTRQSAGSPMKYSPTGVSPAAAVTSQGPTPASRGEVSRQPPADPSSPKAYTPVQEEDTNIFLQQYFEFVTQRMEQDRERQRRKEDNSGFIKSAGNWDEEIDQIANTGKEYIGDVFDNMDAELNNRSTTAEYD
jgi:hypothetical protein